MEKTVQVNEIYYPLLFNQSRYLVLLGGAGSGKSHFAAQKLIFRSLLEKHRFLVIRKISDTLKDSVFKLITSILHEQGIFSLCEVNKTEKTILFPNGSEIIMKGSDDPEKIKSIAGITGIWVEEATEITDADFDQLDLRLRGETNSYKQIILTFNPIDERHWLKKRFFDDPPPGALTLRTTYQDNNFIDAEYENILETKAAASPNFYRIYKLGEWGKAEVKRPAAYNFNLDRHTAKLSVIDKPKEEFIRNIPIRFIQDFNVDPMANVEMKMWRDTDGHHIRFRRENFLRNQGTPEMIEYLKTNYTPFDHSRAIWTGDATARKRTVEQTIKGTEHLHSWKLIDNAFRLGNRLQVPRANPPVKSSLQLMNYILAVHPDIKFDEGMKLTINEMLYTETDEDGEIIKKNRNNEAERADFLDCIRYAFSTWLFDFIDNPNKYIR